MRVTEVYSAYRHSRRFPGAHAQRKDAGDVRKRPGIDAIEMIHPSALFPIGDGHGINALLGQFVAEYGILADFRSRRPRLIPCLKNRARLTAIGVLILSARRQPGIQAPRPPCPQNCSHARRRGLRIVPTSVAGNSTRCGCAAEPSDDFSLALISGSESMAITAMFDVPSGV